MTRRWISILLISGLLMQPHFAFAQPQNDWATVKALIAGEKLVVKLKNGKTVKGETVSVNEQELLVSRKSQSVTLSRDSIAQVYRVVGKPAKGKYALLGAGVGAAAGAGIGAIKYSPDSDDSEIYVLVGLIFGTGIGALTGLGIGASKRKEVLIYQAK